MSRGSSSTKQFFKHPSWRTRSLFFQRELNYRTELKLQNTVDASSYWHDFLHPDFRAPLLLSNRFVKTNSRSIYLQIAVGVWPTLFIHLRDFRSHAWQLHNNRTLTNLNPRGFLFGNTNQFSPPKFHNLQGKSPGNDAVSPQLANSFSTELIIHQVKTAEIIAVSEVWIPDLN